MKNMYYSRVVHKGGHIFEIYRVTQKKGKRFEPLNCGTVLPHTSLKDGINHKCSGGNKRNFYAEYMDGSDLILWVD